MRKNWLSTGLQAVPLAAAILFSASAQAGVISVSSVSVATGGSGSFDVTYQNTGPSNPENIAGFSLYFSLSGTDVTLTGANTSTTLTYIFNGDSFDVINSFPLATSLTAQTFQGSDLSDSGAGTNLGLTTNGLAHILFTVAQNAPASVINVTVATDCVNPNACVSLSDSAGGDVPFTVHNGTITVTDSVPEPSTLLLLLGAAPLLALRRKQ